MGVYRSTEAELVKREVKHNRSMNVCTGQTNPLHPRVTKRICTICPMHRRVESTRNALAESRWRMQISFVILKGRVADWCSWLWISCGFHRVVHKWRWDQTYGCCETICAPASEKAISCDWVCWVQSNEAIDQRVVFYNMVANINKRLFSEWLLS